MSDPSTDAINRLFRVLSPYEKDAFERQVLMGESPEEIAANSGRITRDGVRSLLHRVKKKLRKAVDESPDLARRLWG